MFKLSKIDRVKSLSERNACHCAHEPDYSWRNEKSVPNILGCSDTLDWVPALCYCWLQHNDWNYRYHGKIYNCTQESYWTRTTVYKSLWKSNREDCITLLEKNAIYFQVILVWSLHESRFICWHHLSWCLNWINSCMHFGFFLSPLLVNASTEFSLVFYALRVSCECVCVCVFWAFHRIICYQRIFTYQTRWNRAHCLHAVEQDKTSGPIMLSCTWHSMGRRQKKLYDNTSKSTVRAHTRGIFMNELQMKFNKIVDCYCTVHCVCLVFPSDVCISGSFSCI